MSKWYRLGDQVETSLKGITPSYVDESKVIVLNQKCIRNNRIDYDLARYHDENKKFSDFKILRKGDLLFNSTGQGTAGRCAFVHELPEDKIVITDSHILIVRIDDYYLSECFSYALFGQENFIQSFMDGSTGQGELDKLRLFNIEFKLPESSKREKICKFLNVIDQKIELNNQVNAELEFLAKLIYDFWFVQFDFPDANGKPYKSSGGKMMFNERLKREIPVGWKSGIASKLFEFNPTESIPKGKMASYIDMNALPTKGYMTSEVQQKQFNGGMKFRNKDVLVARITPCLENGKTGLVSLLNEGEVGFGSTEFIVLRGRKKPLPGFASFLSRSEYFRKYAIMNMTGTSGRKRVDAKQLELISIPIPQERLLDCFEEMVQPYFEKMTFNTKENQELASLRDWLLPMLMNGQVTVESPGKNQNQEKVAKRYTQKATIATAAEPGIAYHKNKQFVDQLFEELNLDYEVAAIVLMTEKRFQLNYGKKYIHKMFSNLQMLATLPKVDTLLFQEKGWGMFSKNIAATLDAAKFIYADSLENGYKGFKVKNNALKAINDWINHPDNHLFIEQVQRMLVIYDKSPINREMNKIELFNTVLECIKTLNSYDFDLVYQKMQTWKMEEKGYDCKADKFWELDTKEMLLFISKRGWVV